MLEGGCGIHRLNLSESVLFFKNHIKAYDSYEEFLAQIPTFKAKAPERKIAIECENLDDCEALLKAGADVVQCDKFTPEAVKQAVGLRDKIAPNATIVASGGINLKCQRICRHRRGRARYVSYVRARYGRYHGDFRDSIICKFGEQTRRQI